MSLDDQHARDHPQGKSAVTNRQIECMWLRHFGSRQRQRCSRTGDEVIDAMSRTTHVARLDPGADRFLTFFRKALRGSGACFPIMAVFGVVSSAVAQQGSLPALERIDRDRLCVTNGVVSALPGGRLAIETPSSRAIVQAGTGKAADQIAEIQFQYLGPSQSSKPLASGELRRQIGLKLQAEDSCNLIYAMWHIEPDARVAVSIKQNPGRHTHEQCGAHGYINFKSQDGAIPPPLRPEEAHVLRAELHGKTLTVTADGKVAWQGSFGSERGLPVGPPGFRTDNARFTLEYFTAFPPRSRPPALQASPGQRPCVISEGD